MKWGFLRSPEMAFHGAVLETDHTAGAFFFIHFIGKAVGRHTLPGIFYG